MDSREGLNVRDGLLLTNPVILDFQKALDLAPDVRTELGRRAAAQIILHRNPLLVPPVQLPVALAVNLIAAAKND